MFSLPIPFYSILGLILNKIYFGVDAFLSEWSKVPGLSLGVIKTRGFEPHRMYFYLSCSSFGNKIENLFLVYFCKLNKRIK